MVFKTFQRSDTVKRISAKKTEPNKHDRVLLACGFAFATGWVDVLCTVRFGAFGTMMTGNSINLGKAMVNESISDVLFYSTALVAYCIGVLIHRTIDFKLAEKTSAVAAAAPIVTTSLLAVDVMSFFLGPSRYYVAFACMACGCLNVVSQKVAGVATNAVTGNLQRLTMALWEYLYWAEHEPLTPEAKRFAIVTAYVVVSLLAGVSLSALSINFAIVQHLNFVPVAIAFTLLLYAHDQVYSRELKARREQAAERMEKLFGVTGHMLEKRMAVRLAYKLKKLVKNKASVTQLESSLEHGEQAMYHALPASKEEAEAAPRVVSFFGFFSK